jgi:two-component system, LuxR family, response regulator FixJ
MNLDYPASMPETRCNQAGAGKTPLPPRKSTIYIVDDDFDVLKSLRFLFETEGFDVRTFHSGSALLGSRARRDADCLVVDYKMPGIDGLELARRLRGLGIDTPTVLITGNVDEDLSAKARSAGVRQVLKKPHLAENLAAAVRDAISHSNGPG